MARRVLKTLEMDEEYEGNVEVFVIFFILLSYLDVVLCKLIRLILFNRLLERIIQLSQLSLGGRSVLSLMLVLLRPPLETVSLVP